MDVNKESHFFETASIFEENRIERNTVNALRNHATGVGMGVLVQMDEIVKCCIATGQPNAEITDGTISPTLTQLMGTGGNNVPMIVTCFGIGNDGNPQFTLSSAHEHAVCYGISRSIVTYEPVCVMATSCWNAPFTDGSLSPALCARAGTGGNQLPLIVLKRDEE
jgi:hypothetical protein